MASGPERSPTDQELAACFGPRADGYIRHYRRYQADGRVRASWIWAGLLVPQLWLLYRRLYGWAAATLILAVLAEQLVPWAHFGLGMPCAVALYGRHWCISRAQRRFAALYGRRLSAAERLKLLAQDDAVSPRSVALAAAAAVAIAAVAALTR